ncbi:uncharacterized protein LOC130670435 [Microplitis mediator]|uniref:uncharacterized protein LOC130670435 n=1 Tax=Microplitis mediator TaxID=375433 RepID=UPI002556D694|nr:uncharacterized protein LOC130670435 [Microplitis mediator]
MIISIEGTRTELIVGSAYFPYEDANVPTKEVTDLVEYCRSEGLPLLIGCDVNAHHTVWSSSDINERGSTLLEYLSTTCLEILNVGSRPTFVTSWRQEVIDITLGSNKIAQSVTNWRVSEEDSLSDHRRIHFSLEGSRNGGTGGTYRNRKATDWLIYKKELVGRLGEPCGTLRTAGRIEQAVEHLQTAIVQSYEIACPLKTRKCSKRVIWWNAELSRLCSWSRKLLNKALKTRADQNWAEYKTAQIQYKRCIKVSKAEAWRKFCGKIKDLPLVARLRKIFTSGPTVKLGDLTLPDRRATANHREILAHLFEVHFPGSEFPGKDRGLQNGP